MGRGLVAVAPGLALARQTLARKLAAGNSGRTGEGFGTEGDLNKESSLVSNDALAPDSSGAALSNQEH
jgi:hypothetical protein